jgi:hypothetical protein
MKIPRNVKIISFYHYNMMNSSDTGVVLSEFSVAVNVTVKLPIVAY